MIYEYEIQRKSDEVHSKATRTATEADFKRCTVSV